MNLKKFLTALHLFFLLFFLFSEDKNHSQFRQRLSIRARTSGKFQEFKKSENVTGNTNENVPRENPEWRWKIMLKILADINRENIDIKDEFLPNHKNDEHKLHWHLPRISELRESMLP